MQDSSLNHLPQMHTFASMRRTPFMEIDDKGGEIVQIYESFALGEIVKALGDRLRRYESFGDRLRRYESFGRN